MGAESVKAASAEVLEEVSAVVASAEAEEEAADLFSEKL